MSLPLNLFLSLQKMSRMPSTLPIFPSILFSTIIIPIPPPKPVHLPEPHTFLPVSSPCQICQKLSALADVRGRRSTEWDHRLAGEIVGFHEAVYWPCGNAPPDRILNRRSSLLVYDFTGLNGIRKCVLCSHIPHDSYSRNPISSSS